MASVTVGPYVSCNVNLDARQPSILDMFGVTQMGAVAVGEPDRLVLRDGHVIDVVAVPLRVEAR